MNFNRIVLVAGALFAVSQVQAQTFTLTSLNTSARLTFGAAAGAPFAGAQLGPVRDWSVGDQGDGLWEQGYYVKIGSGPVVNVNQFFVSANQVSADRIDAFYFDNLSGLAMNIRFLLTGSPGGNTADMAEVVTVHNNGNNNVAFSLYQFNDFDLRGSFTGDTATKLNSSTIQQVENGHSITVGVTGIPDIATVGLADGVGNIRTRMINGTLTQNNTFTGDAAFIFGYDEQLAAGQSWQMSANKVYAVPEPATMVALGLGAAAMLRRRKKK